MTRPAELPPPSAAGRRDTGAALALAGALAALYLGPSDLLPGNDATGSVYTAATLLATGQPAIDPIRLPFLFAWDDRRPGGRPLQLTDLEAPVDGVPAAVRVAAGELVPVAPYFLVRAARDGPGGAPRFVSAFGPGAPFAALPVLAPLHLVAGDLARRPELLWCGARVAAALLTAASAAFLFLAARRWLPRGPAVALALLFGLGTPAWSIASQTLWQHPADLFFLALGALALVRGEGRPGGAALAGLSLGAAAACRPQSALVAAVAFAALAWRDRRGAGAYALGALGPALGLTAWNWWWLGGPLRFGQVGASRAIALAKTGVADPWPFRLGESLPGLLLSPSRGLLVFTPLLALSAVGAVAAFRDEAHRPLRPLAVAAGVLLLVEAGWYDWWGGWSYGWRRLLALAPLLTLLLVPAWRWVAAARWRAALAAVLAAWSVAVQGAGALAYDVSGWNARPAWRVALPSGVERLLLDPGEAFAAGAAVQEWMDVDRPAWRGRLWSLRDAQIPYTFAHFQALRRSRRVGAAAWIASFGASDWSAAPRP